MDPGPAIRTGCRPGGPKPPPRQARRGARVHSRSPQPAAAPAPLRHSQDDAFPLHALAHEVGRAFQGDDIECEVRHRRRAGGDRDETLGVQSFHGQINVRTRGEPPRGCERRTEADGPPGALPVEETRDVAGVAPRPTVRSADRRRRTAGNRPAALGNGNPEIRGSHPPLRCPTVMPRGWSRVQGLIGAKPAIRSKERFRLGEWSQAVRTSQPPATNSLSRPL